VTDRARRAEYRARLNQLTAAARREVSGPTPADKAEALLKFLHAGPMAKGYVARQTTLSGLLDTGEFNCVSSAVLYALIARRLGLQVRAVEVPGYLLAGHVFIVLHDGRRRIDVETTNARGFDPRGVRKRPDGGEYDPAKDPAGRREVGETGLAALIYYNRGVALREQKRYLEALRADFSALALDSTSPSAARNARAEFLLWAEARAKAGQHKEALPVLAVALQVAPADRDLDNGVLFLAQEWIKDADAAGGPHAAATALAEVRRQFPAAAGLRDVGINHIRRVMSDSLKQARYADALAALKRYTSLLDRPEDARALGAWVYDWRAEDLRTKKNWAGAVAVYAEGLGAYPREARLRQNAVATYDRWARNAIDAKDWAEAIHIYELGLAQFPGDSHLAGNLAYCQSRLKK
jgi:tetratricopeptide (TPR) repeat protein